MVGLKVDSRQLQETRHIWSNVTLNEPKFNCNSYTTIDNTLGGGGVGIFGGEVIIPLCLQTIKCCGDSQNHNQVHFTS